MSLLISSAAIQRARIALPVELLACSFHSSQVNYCECDAFLHRLYSNYLSSQKSTISSTSCREFEVNRTEEQTLWAEGEGTPRWSQLSPRTGALQKGQTQIRTSTCPVYSRHCPSLRCKRPVYERSTGRETTVGRRFVPFSNVAG